MAQSITRGGRRHGREPWWVRPSGASLVVGVGEDEEARLPGGGAVHQRARNCPYRRFEAVVGVVPHGRRGLHLHPETVLRHAVGPRQALATGGRAAVGAEAGVGTAETHQGPPGAAAAGAPGGGAGIGSKRAVRAAGAGQRKVDGGGAEPGGPAPATLPLIHRVHPPPPGDRLGRL